MDEVRHWERRGHRGLRATGAYRGRSMRAQIHAGSSVLPSTLPWGTVVGHHVVRGANNAGADVRGLTMRSGSEEGKRGEPGQTRAPSGMVVWLRSA